MRALQEERFVSATFRGGNVRTGSWRAAATLSPVLWLIGTGRALGDFLTVVLFCSRHPFVEGDENIALAARVSGRRMVPKMNSAFVVTL
jgi:hypothetical protein